MSGVDPSDVSRPGSLRRRLNSTICAVDCDEIHEEGQPTSFECVRIGTIDVIRHHGQRLRHASRSIHHIRDNPVDDFLILLPVNTPFEVAQIGNETSVEPGKFVLVATQKPFEGYCGKPADRIYTELKVKVPGSLLRQKIPHLDHCCGVPVAFGDGIGSVTKSILELVLSERGPIPEEKARMYSTMLVSAIGIAVLDAPELRDFPSSARELGQASVRLRAESFIESRLSDPMLNCAAIAAHCGISLRHLHASFEASSTTVWTAIRASRLRHCRDDLLNPALRRQSILQIAMRWGFRSSASFTRMYQEHYGRSPSEERKNGLPP